MSRIITVHETFEPLHASSSTAAGKFYAAIIAEVQDGAGILYVPVYNWGAGDYQQHTSGQVGLGKFYGSGPSATNEALAQIRKKEAKGYFRDYSVKPNLYAPASHKVRDLINKHMDAASVVAPNSQPPQGRTILTPGQPVPAPRPGSTTKKPRPSFEVPPDSPTTLGEGVVKFADGFELFATRVVTATDPDKAIDELVRLRESYAKYEAQHDRIQSAMEMAEMKARHLLSTA